MENKKTIILGLTAAIFLAGIVWFAGKYGQDIMSQTASVLGSSGEEQSAGEILADEFFLGSPDAPVTIIGYSGHFCGHCANFHNNTLPLIMDEYIKSGQVKFAPRLLSPSELGIAVLCAQEQGGFSEFNGYLFKNGKEISAVIKNARELNIEIVEAITDYLKKTAGVLELDQDKFNLCFDSGTYIGSVEKWFEQAREAGVEGTPTFFINGKQIVGNQPYSVFKSAIEEALKE
ncbi:MAG: thioredoxin domain-containing protein [Patescibacteria group bacterium]|nr:thioredoxin domain-containing protein [Patescibacteria group bacterium]